MIEMTIVLLASGILMALASELAFLPKRKWGENYKSFF